MSSVASDILQETDAQLSLQQLILSILKNSQSGVFYMYLISFPMYNDYEEEELWKLVQHI